MADGYATGECVITSWPNLGSPVGDVFLRIDRADPWIQANDEFIAELQQAGMAGEGLFRIDATNGSVTYAQRIYNAQQGYWVCERMTPWPTAPSGASTS